MEFPVNRRIRDKAMVFGLPADRFMICLMVMCAPVMFVLFLPWFAVVWIPWMAGVYKAFLNGERLARLFRFGRQFPLHLKNR